MDELAAIVAQAEDAVERMYERSGEAGAYAEAKDFFGDALALARKLGRAEDVKKLEARLAEVKAVFRTQLG